MDTPPPRKRKRRRRELTPELEEELYARADKAFFMAIAGLFLLGIPSGFALMEAGAIKTLSLEVGLEVPPRAIKARKLCLVAAAGLALLAVAQVALFVYSIASDS